MLKAAIKKFYFNRFSLWDMAVSQFKAKYAGSRLGIWWAVVTPVILAASINFVFSLAFKINIPRYALFVLSGILPWLFFNNALMEATNSFSAKSSILKQGMFPREFIPVSSVLANLLNFLVGLIFLLPLFIILKPAVVLVLPWLIIVISLYFIFISGLGLLLSCANVFFRDLAHLLSAVFMIWFWITPVFYSLEMLRYPFRWVCLLNPITYFVVAYQQVLFSAQAPSRQTFLVISLIAIFSLILGYVFFIKKEASLLKRI
ncbi:MAG: ABC transporter permease [Candidatus Omnitrophica bacterium]|nr:ABC transporter permease [Candidatus Omnitrophota bacterium]